MGISHEYHSTSHRARHGGVSGKLRLAGVVLAILVLAYAITAILENGASAKDAQSEPVASGILNLLTITREYGESLQLMQEKKTDKVVLLAQSCLLELIEQYHSFMVQESTQEIDS